MENNKDGQKPKPDNRLAILLGAFATGKVVNDHLPEIKRGISRGWKTVKKYLNSSSSPAVLPPPQNVNQGTPPPSRLTPLCSPQIEPIIDITDSIAQLRDALVPYIEPPDMELTRTIVHPAVVLVGGRRGGGKTALAMRIQENMRDIAAPYGVALPSAAQRLLPDWYGLAESVQDVPPNSTVYLGEAWRLFHARTGGGRQGLLVGEIINLSRHRRWTLIIDTQDFSHIDRNVITGADLVLLKEPAPFAQGFERPQFREIFGAARGAFSALTPSRKRRAVWVVANDGQNGRLLENALPSFWSDRLSRMFAAPLVGISQTTTHSAASNDRVASGDSLAFRRGQRISNEGRRQRAGHLRASGNSYAAIARELGVSKSQAYRLVNE